MKLKKPDFWDYKKPSFLSYMLLPFTIPIILNNFFLKLKKKKKNSNILTICVGNIYVGGTGKTQLTIKINQILKNLNLRTATVKKFYKDQIDEQNLLANKTELYCLKSRKAGLSKAIENNIEIALFDDGLQDSSINYDLKFVCFSNIKWIGNGMLIPSGPLRENLKSISKYDAIFLNGNNENVSDLKLLIKKYNPDIQIFETQYIPNNINKFYKKNKYLVFSGIGNPDVFKKTLVKNKFNVIKEIKFPDHYQYTSKDINKIKQYAKELNAKILTTEKDYVKINDSDLDKIDFLGIDVVIKQEEELIKLIKSNL